MTHGVIGNTAGFGPAILGSSPSGSTGKSLDNQLIIEAFFITEQPMFYKSAHCLPHTLSPKFYVFSILMAEKLENALVFYS